MNNRKTGRLGRQRGFSLAELMIVLTVIGILLALAAPNLFSLLQANTLTSEGASLRNRLTNAQQEALSRNADVEVRFFKFEDETQAQDKEQYRGYQFFRYDSAGEVVPISQFFRLKAPMVFSSSKSLSTLLQPEGTHASPASGKFEIPLREGTRSAPFVSFRFRPDGSTDLPGKSGSDTWHVTLVDENQPPAGGSGGAPQNFFTVQMDPFNGRVYEFRP